MMAEYERAMIVERHRRGKLHAALAGRVNVLAGAPYGYRSIDKHAGGGQARYEVLPDEARVVRQVFDWVGGDRVTIGEVCRRLTRAGEHTRTGRTVWERSVVGGILHNPAYQGTAAFGKTRQGPLRPRLRAQRGRPVQPRRATADYGVPASEWLSIPVPALVDAGVFAAVQEQLQDNRRHARQSRRGARYLLQGLVQCQQCGYAFYGKPISRTAAKGKTRTYAYYRCLGTEAYRFGGERVCTNAQVRTDLLDVTVWREVQGVLAHPERVAEEYQRRLQTTTAGTHQAQATLEAQLGKVRQGLARLIDSYAEGLLEKHEFEPRITRLRQRIIQLEEQRQQLIDVTALQTEIRLIVGRLEDFAAKIDTGLEDSDWLSKREMIRALGKRVEVTPDRVNVVFRVDAYPGEASPEKKVCNFVGGVVSPLLANIYLHTLDKYMESTYLNLPQWQRQKRRHQGKSNFLYVRYADDFVVLCNGRKGKMIPKVLIPDRAIKRFRHNIRRILSPSSENDSAKAKITAVNRVTRGWCEYYRCTNSPAMVFNQLRPEIFWGMAHWLGRKYKSNMPEVMRKYRKGNTFKYKSTTLIMPDEYKAKRFVARTWHNPYTETDKVRAEKDRIKREILLTHNETWIGNENRHGDMDLREEVLLRNGSICATCKQNFYPYEVQVDHITPRARFKNPADADRLENLQVL